MDRNKTRRSPEKSVKIAVVLCAALCILTAATVLLFLWK